MTNTNSLTNNETSLYPEKTKQKLKKIDSLVNILMGIIAFLVICGVLIQYMNYSH